MKNEIKNVVLRDVFSTSLSLAGSSGRLTWVRPAAARAAPPIPISVRVVFSCVQTMVWLPLSRMCNGRTDVDACDYTRGLHGHRKIVCTGSKLQALVYDILPWRKVPENGARSVHRKLTLGEKSFATLGTRTRVSTAPSFSVGRSTN